MKYSEGDCAYKHNHYPVDFSCVYYISVTEKSSPIVFENKLKVQPKDGMLVLFPGIIHHNVFPTKDKRIAFAANFVKIQTWQTKLNRLQLSHDSVAQRIEQLPSKQSVVGSNPTWVALPL